VFESFSPPKEMQRVTLVATKAFMSGMPVFRMKVLAQKACYHGPAHLQFQVIDPEGAKDWVCSKDVDILESEPQPKRERASDSESDGATSQEDDEKTEDSGSDSIPSSGRMVVDELKYRALEKAAAEAAELKAEVKELKKQLQALESSRKKRKH
jgi:hypothetical protein